MFNIRSVDLNLLPVFEAVYEEKSLSRAAVRLAMTQSAISHALSRLRFVFRDELFVRQSRGVIPTPAADRVYPKVRDALASPEREWRHSIAFYDRFGGPGRQLRVDQRPVSGRHSAPGPARSANLYGPR